MKVYKVDIEFIKYNFPYNFYRNFTYESDAKKYANDLYYSIINGKEIVSTLEDKEKGNYRFKIGEILFRIITEEYTLDDDLSSEKIYIDTIKDFLKTF